MRNRRSPTGRNDGYTLIEVLLTVSVLAFSFSFLLPAFRGSAEGLRRISVRQDASLIAENLIADAEGYLRENKTLDSWPNEGKKTSNGVPYRYTARLMPQDRYGLLQELTVSVFPEAGMSAPVSKSAYVSRASV